MITSYTRTKLIQVFYTQTRNIDHTSKVHRAVTMTLPEQTNIYQTPWGISTCKDLFPNGGNSHYTCPYTYTTFIDNYCESSW